ncbi:hypothetical protein B296_00005866 [Ensete ventricosum]|uniref:Uncharacterized protein n=1 Tax=Ensete ventricosum TaxID=4639 RepID=A0A427A6P8_ENSVE|nr:hypothetical protein B296_00005866 [Ensete ventricosum]
MTPTPMSGMVMINGWIWTPRHVEKLGPCSHLHRDHHLAHRHPSRNRGLTSPLGRNGLNRRIKFHEIDLQIRFGTNSRILWFGHLQNLGQGIGWGRGPGGRTRIRRRARPFGVEISACSCRLAIRTRSSRRRGGAAVIQAASEASFALDLAGSFVLRSKSFGRVCVWPKDPKCLLYGGDANFFVRCFRLSARMEMQEKRLWQTAGEPHSTATELKWGRPHNSLLFGSAPAGRMGTVTEECE